MLSADRGAIRQSDPHSGQRRTKTRAVGESRSELEQPWPLARVLRGRDLAVRLVHKTVATITQQPARGDLARVQLLPGHRLDRVAPQRRDGTRRRVHRVRHALLLLRRIPPARGKTTLSPPCSVVCPPL